MKKVISILLSVAMLISMVSLMAVSASAASLKQVKAITFDDATEFIGMQATHKTVLLLLTVLVIPEEKLLEFSLKVT